MGKCTEHTAVADGVCANLERRKASLGEEQEAGCAFPLAKLTLTEFVGPRSISKAAAPCKALHSRHVYSVQQPVKMNIIMFAIYSFPRKIKIK